MGADAVGLILAPSTRQVDPDTVRDIVRRAAPGHARRRGVPQRAARAHRRDRRARPARRGAAARTARRLRRPRSCGGGCRSWCRPSPPTIRRLARIDDYPVDAVLLDSSTPGSGVPFDWRLAERFVPGRRVILAGGLTAGERGRRRRPGASVGRRRGERCGVVARPQGPGEGPALRGQRHRSRSPSSPPITAPRSLASAVLAFRSTKLRPLSEELRPRPCPSEPFDPRPCPRGLPVPWPFPSRPPAVASASSVVATSPRRWSLRAWSWRPPSAPPGGTPTSAASSTTCCATTPVGRRR